MRLWNGSSRISHGLSFRQRAHGGLMAGCFALAVVMATALPPSASARVHSYIVVNTRTGAVLKAHNADVRTYPASLTKLMTLYITFHELATRKITLGQRFRVSAYAAAQPPSKMGLRPGERVSVNSLILGITSHSANDAAMVLAEGIGGSEANFVRIMNRDARRLGMDRTTFRNPSGLPNWRQKTTARDMATLALAVMHTYPQYFHYFSIESFNFHGRVLYSFDHLLGRCPGVDGMKTGYTHASGFNIVTSAVRDGQHLLGVVMGSPTAYSRDRLMEVLLNRSFALNRQRIMVADAQKPAEKAPAAAKYERVSDVHTEETRSLPAPDPAWIVQVGGKFRSSHQVRQVLHSALLTAPRSLKGAAPLVVLLSNGWYLARFANMSEEAARRAYEVLRDRGYTCAFFHIPSSRLVLASARR